MHSLKFGLCCCAACLINPPTPPKEARRLAAKGRGLACKNPGQEWQGKQWTACLTATSTHHASPSTFGIAVAKSACTQLAACLLNAIAVGLGEAGGGLRDRHRQDPPGPQFPRDKSFRVPQWDSRTGPPCLWSPLGPAAFNITTLQDSNVHGANKTHGVPVVGAGW
jgi:hypothetical protein